MLWLYLLLLMLMMRFRLFFHPNVVVVFVYLFLFFFSWGCFIILKAEFQLQDIFKYYSLKAQVKASNGARIPPMRFKLCLSLSKDNCFLFTTYFSISLCKTSMIIHDHFFNVKILIKIILVYLIKLQKSLYIVLIDVIRINYHRSKWEYFSFLFSFRSEFCFFYYKFCVNQSKGNKVYV